MSVFLLVWAVCYADGMSLSASNGRPLDVTGYGLTWDDLPPASEQAVDLRELFGFKSPDESPRPMELEVGSGKGTFLVQHAPTRPDVDFLGIEYARAFFRYAGDRVRRHAMPNVRMLYADASSFIRLYVGDAKISQVHLYFPDPWPKARHHKRRFVQIDMLGEVHRILENPVADRAESGCLRIATDHADYFEWMEEKAQACSHLFERHEFVSPQGAEEGELVGTNFERKYREEGRSFHGMILRKIPQ